MERAEIEDMLETARERFREGDYKVAESLAAQLLMHEGRNPEIFHMLATIYYDQGKFNKAIKTFRRALEIDPGYTDASVGLSIILNDLGRYAEGKAVFIEAQERLESKKRQEDPKLLDLLASKHEELGDLYFQNHRFDEAIEQWDKSLKFNPRKAELKMKRVDALMKLEKPDHALRELRLITQEHPQYIPAKLQLGLLFFEAHKVTEAVEQWEAVLRRDPNHPVAQKYLGMAQETGLTALM